MFKAESNIVTDQGTIPNGETFNPDHYKLAAKDIERWISIGLVSRVDSENRLTVQQEEPAVEESTEADHSGVDADDRRKQPRKATK